jgi:acyl-CoA synthetase (AMP-forming)/AMP-acid ligase II
LNRAGIGRDDRVAIVLPNGPEAAAAFLGVATCATAAPLNPAYRQDEFDFYLSDLKAKAIIVSQDTGAIATDAAARLNIPAITLSSTRSAKAGQFTLDTRALGNAQPQKGGPAEPDDIALLLHTSGTTSRPKIVPLTQRNLCASARNICDTLAFTPSDRGLEVMPLFHVHGLVAGILAPLSAGGSVYCTPGFNALKFFHWMEEARPTWFTAVPTMHQAILDRATGKGDIIRSNPLRFLRSSSAPLPPVIQNALEACFHAPVIEAYGMTEAAHQIASNPLPPGRRVKGSVGLAAGPDVAIMSSDGMLLGAGQAGEIVIRGANVLGGYEGNPEANREAFAHGWLRTGDLGVLAEDGYLSITGRLKDIINRGGEKISPREIDDVLMEHPAVFQAVTFAIPHDKLGEDVGAAIVCRQKTVVSERDLCEFVRRRLADFKVPRRILFVDEIPMGPTGKLQRAGLSRRLGLVDMDEPVPAGGK